jgi:Tol biopolymer transport system component
VSEFNVTQGQFSPDGRWLAYVSDESGQPQIYVEPFPATPERNGRVTVSTGGGVTPRWRRDGRELLYLTDDLRTVMSTTVTAGTPTFNASAAQPLLKMPVAVAFKIAGIGRGGPGDSSNATWDVTADGSRFLFVTVGTTQAARQSPLTVVLNWTQLLKP